MWQSQLHYPTLHSNDEYPAIVASMLESAAPQHQAARATLRRDVRDYVECFAKFPVRRLNQSEHARHAIADLVLQRLDADDCGLLREWRNRVLRGRDQAAFWTMIKTVVWYSAIEYAHNAERGPPWSPAHHDCER
jgi:hypothetical protein